MKGLCVEVFDDKATFTVNGAVVGNYYEIENATNGTSAQNRFFHKLVMEYFKSGLHPTMGGEPYDKLRDWVKDRLGEGKEKFIFAFVNESGLLEHGECKNYEDIPQDVIDGFKDQTSYAFGKLKSWSKYTKKQRMKCIDNLISDMTASGVNSRDFMEMIQERGIYG